MADAGSTASSILSGSQDSTGQIDSAYKDAAMMQMIAIIVHAALDAAIQTALAENSRSSSSSIANYQNEIAKRQVALAQAVHDHAKEFWDYEQAFLSDAFGMGYNDPQYSALANSWVNYMDDSHDAYFKFLKEDLACFCISLSQCEQANWKRNKQKDRAQIIYHADRQAEGRADALNDYRYAVQYGALGIGREMLNNIPAYWELAAQSKQGVRNLLVNSINGAREAWGYWARSGDTFEHVNRIPGPQQNVDMSPYMTSIPRSYVGEE